MTTLPLMRSVVFYYYFSFKDANNQFVFGLESALKRRFFIDLCKPTKILFEL